MKLPGAGPPLLPEVCSGRENLGNPGAADPLTAPNGVAWPCEGAAAAAVVPSAVNASLKGTPDWAAEGAAGSALVGVMKGAVKGAAGAKPAKGAAAASAAEAGSVLLLSAHGALEA